LSWPLFLLWLRTQAGRRNVAVMHRLATVVNARFAKPHRIAAAAFAVFPILGFLWGLGAGSAPLEAAQLFAIADFAFEDGSVLPDLRVAYDTAGTLSPARDNAILLMPGAINDRHVFDPLIGPGRTFDTARYFVITVDPVGGGESTSPADGLGQDFPRYTIRDMMEAQHTLVTRGLGIARLRALVGVSMGSFVALEWGIHHPDSVGSLILLAPSPNADASFRLTVDLISATIALDPEWQGGLYTHNPVEGLRHAGMLFYPWVVSTAYINRLAPRDLAQELEAGARAFAAWDANALVLRQAAYRAHDVAAPYGGDMTAALARLTAPTLLLPSASDRLVGTDGARRIRDGIKQPTYTEISSDLGHRAVRMIPDTPEGNFIDRQVRRFLATPTGPPAD
jgi:homoserine O-acetyltransferase/O-succinyltransferase